jgi:HSP20 family molecular chaperone IbpA
MSLARQLMQEFRPLFRMLEEPISRPFPSSFNNGMSSHLLRSSLLGGLDFTHPAVDITEKKDKYVLEAELPGVTKENIEVRIGDAGRSVTIEGRISNSVNSTPRIEAAETKAVEEPKGEHPITRSDIRQARKLSPLIESSESPTNAADEAQNQISSERTFIKNASFSRTVFLPRPVDPDNVSAKLEHGILTITVDKAEDKASRVIPID